MFEQGQQLIKPKHPQAESARVFGILALVFIALNFVCGCTAPISIILGIVAYNKAKRVINEFQQNASIYSLDSLKQAEGAKTMGLVGAIIGGIITLAAIVFLIIVILMDDGQRDDLFND